MTMKNFLNDFKDSSTEVSRKRAVRNTTSRTLWRIVDHFSVLPSNKDFQNLTAEQTDWIVLNLNLDADEANKARKGIKSNEAFEDYDTGWVHEKEAKFNPLKDGHEEEDIAKQVEALSSKEYLEKLKESFSSIQEWQTYLSEHQDEYNVVKADQERRLQENLDKAYAEAKSRKNGTFVQEDKENASMPQITRDKGVLTDEAKEAIKLFNGEEDDDVIWF